MAPLIRITRTCGLVLLTALTSCKARPLEAAAGRYVTIHWDPREQQLCGGTLAYVDRSLEVMAATYGVGLPARPAIDIFWVDKAGGIVSALCSQAYACTLFYDSGLRVVVSESPINHHELAHTLIFGDRRSGLSSFFSEGVAVRWGFGPGSAQVGVSTYVGNLDYDDVVRMLRQPKIDISDYPSAGFFWAWLEAEFGANALALFAARIDRSSSVAEIEHEFERAFGVTLRAAVSASNGAPMFTTDVHACAMDAPVIAWTPDGLVIPGGASDCSSDDVISLYVSAMRVSRIELPEDGIQPYQVRFSGEGFVQLYPCREVLRPYSDPHSYSTSGLTYSSLLHGNYAVVVTAPLAEDGTVNFPRVEVGPPP